MSLGVENGLDEVKQVADEIIHSNAEQGVLQYLESLEL